MWYSVIYVVMGMSRHVVVHLFNSCVFCLFFFKQKTAYEMRISDWSSDVCSSDLSNVTVFAVPSPPDWSFASLSEHAAAASSPARVRMESVDFSRSEERRVGKECVQYV